MSKNSKYWDERAARQMVAQMKTAEEAAEDIARLYELSSQYIRQEGKKIFQKFATDTGLTEQEAEQILKAVKSPKDINAVLRHLKTMPPGKRKAVKEWLKANAVQYRIDRLANLQRQIDKMMPQMFASSLGIVNKAFQKIMQKSYLRSIFDIQQYAGYGWDVKTLGARDLQRIMNERWIGGNYSATLWGDTEALAQTLKEELTLSFITGRSEHETVKAIQKKYVDQSEHVIRRLVRTESNYLANQAQIEAMRQSGIEEYVFVAILDLRTSEVCQSMDKTVHKVKDAQAGKNLPPMHPWCRSTIRGYFGQKALAAIKQRAWNPESGRYELVPGDMTYQQWYNKYVKTKPEGTPKAPEPREGRNLTREQYDRYKDRLGDDFPYSYEEFLRMKREDPDLWKAWQKSYKASSRGDKFNDLTAVWEHNRKVNMADVSDADHYTAPDGTRYDVDGEDVRLDYDPNGDEYLAAPLLSKAIGANVSMCPRVIGKHTRVKTPDYLVGKNQQRWDHKGLHGKGKDALRKRILGKDGRGSEQAENYMIDLSDWKGSSENALEQAEMIFTWPNTVFVDHVFLVNKGAIIASLKRKK